MAKLNVFVTVGTALDPFDRLITVADELIGTLGVEVEGVCQFGRCGARSRFLENVAFLERSAFLLAVQDADVVFTGAGAGTLSVCISAGHRPIVLPRRHDLGECVNDHQFELTAALAERGQIVDATQADIVSTFKTVAKTHRRHATQGPERSLPDLSFEHKARYRAFSSVLARPLSRLVGLTSLKIRG